MADDAPEQSSKTEDPSQKKLDDAHKRGDVVKSQEVTTWFMLAGSRLLVLADGAVDERGARRQPQAAARQCRSVRDRRPGASGSSSCGLAELDRAGRAGPAGGRSLVFAVAANLVQHRPLLSVDPITPKLSQDLADRRLPPAVLARGAGQFRQGPRQDRRRRAAPVLRALARARPARDDGHRRSGAAPRRSSRSSASRSSARCSRWSPSSRSPTTSTSATAGGTARR